MVDDLSSALEKLKNIEDKTKKFEDMLSELTSSEDKKKLLWKESYQNAIEDRESASILLNDLLVTIPGNSANHSTHGSLATKYLERILLPINPSHTPERTGTFLIFLASRKAVDTVSSEVLSATTISNNFIMLAGEKKCNPITSCGLDVVAAISFILR